MEWVMMIRPQVASNCKTQQDISLPASFDGKNKLSTDIYTKLNKLHLQTFRNYEIAELDLESDAVVLTGPNGAGKTNLLEAVSMLAPGRGLRRARREELGYLGDQQQTETDCQIPAWSVFADLNGSQGVVSVGTGCLAGQPERSRRAVKINGVNASQADLAQAVIAFTSSLKNFFGVQNDDPEKNFFVNDFELFQPLNHTSSAVTVFEEALNCACDRFEPVFGIFFAVFREEHAVKALDNLLQSVIRAGQMIFRLLVKDYPDIYLVSFKLEKFAVELGLAMDNLMFHTLESIIKMFTNEFKITKRPTEAVFTGLGQIVAGGIHTVATMGVNGPLSVVGSTFQPDISAFETEVWSIDKAVSFAHRSVYSGAVFTQWLVFIMEKLVTSSFSIDDVFTSEDTPLELNCDWAKDVKEHRYVSVGYTAGCAAYNYGIAYINLAAIVYGASIELLTKSIFTQEQNAFRTLQRWEGPQIARNKVFTCEERTRMSAYDYDTNTYYKEGHLWTQDRSKCNCNRIYGDSMAEGEAYYQPWCGQLNLNFDVFAPMDALVMHLSHGVFGPGFGDAFPFIPPRDNVRMHFTVADREVDKTIPLGITIPPLTRTSIESL